MGERDPELKKAMKGPIFKDNTQTEHVYFKQYPKLKFDVISSSKQVKR